MRPYNVLSLLLISTSRSFDEALSYCYGILPLPPLLLSLRKPISRVRSSPSPPSSPPSPLSLPPPPVTRKPGRLLSPMSCEFVGHDICARASAVADHPVCAAGRIFDDLSLFRASHSLPTAASGLSPIAICSAQSLSAVQIVFRIYRRANLSPQASMRSARVGQ